MKVLGLSIGHDSNACLVEDGKIVRYAAEERFNRIKVGLNPPSQAVKYCLGEYKMEDIDRVVISSGVTETIGLYLGVLLTKRKFLGIPSHFRETSYDVPSYGTVDHHLCHASSAYYTSGLKDSLIVSIDGVGENTTHAIYDARNGKITPIHLVNTTGTFTRGKIGVFEEHRFPTDVPRSLGWFYGAVTEALGWRMCCDEGKVMGLAPYGDPSVIPESEMRLKLYEPGYVTYYVVNGRCYYRTESSDYYEALAKKYGRENLAAAAQSLLEKEAIALIGEWLEKTGHKNLCCSGGVFLNVKLNQKIRETFKLDNFWPFPLAGDSGLAIGAALHEYWKKCGKEFLPNRIQHLYYGPEYPDDEIKRILDLAKLRYKPYDVGYVARSLAENKIVAWFQGRMEGGPRALGGRSILMSPLKAENKDKINREVKFREGFRPFCPSVTEEAADRYFEFAGEFMIEGAKVKTDAVPAVTHVDLTARPQSVKESVNPKFHALLSEFGKLTGHPVLLNTSLNIMGQPIICDPMDALRCFFSVGLDMLVIGNFIVEKEPS